MPDKPNHLLNFWQELKRRKVLRVITVYAAVAFVILQLVEILAPSLRLPEWTMNLILVVLIVGFIIAIILSWIYDIHPEEGIVKTEPVRKLKIEEIPKSSNSWKIASYISFVVIVGLIILNIVPRKGTKENEILDKSLAVLPFRNESSDQENTYFINGIMESVLDNLSKIEDLRVISRNSVEQYRNNPKPTPVVAEEMNVSYIIEGSGQKIGKRLLLSIQLIVGKDDYHIWSKQYDRNIQRIEDLIDIQKEIAQLVASEIEAIIAPEKVPTTSLTAYDFYQRGREEHLKFELDNNNRKALERAEDIYYKALEYDSTFAQAYTGLAMTEYSKHYSMEPYSGSYSDTYFEGEFLDSVLILADIALSFDDQLAEAYTVKGSYFFEKGLTEQAIKEFDKAIKFNPNDWMAYYGKGGLHMYDDLLKTIDNLQKAASLNHGSELPMLLVEIGWAYFCAGFNEKHNYYIQEALKLGDDSVTYYIALAVFERVIGNYEKAIEFGEKVYKIDSNHTHNLSALGGSYTALGQYEESLKYYKKWFERIKALGILSINNMHRIGYVYWLNGYKEEAEYYFDEQINYCNRSNELGRSYAKRYFSYYDLAAVYAFRGDRYKAYENLKIFNQRQMMPLWMVTFIKTDPLFDNIRDEHEFQQIVRDVEAKYQAEHERVKKWLDENDML
jgi:TolB-like protein/Flp pilus assembly protein TadD